MICWLFHRAHHRIVTAEGDNAVLGCLKCHEVWRMFRLDIPRWVPPRRVHWNAPYAAAKPACDLVKVEDYDAGDPTLEISRNADGTYDLTIARHTDDLTVPSLSSSQVREAALLILDLVPSPGWDVR